MHALRERSRCVPRTAGTATSGRLATVRREACCASCTPCDTGAPDCEGASANRARRVPRALRRRARLLRRARRSAPVRRDRVGLATCSSSRSATRSHARSRSGRWGAPTSSRRTTAYMADAIVALGAAAIEGRGGDARRRRVVRRAVAELRECATAGSEGAPVILSTRAHEPLYNIGEIIDAYARIRGAQPGVRLVVAHSGSLTAASQRHRRPASRRHRVHRAPSTRERLRDAHDERRGLRLRSRRPTARPSRCCRRWRPAASRSSPICATQREWIEDGVNGFRVPLHATRPARDRITRALEDAGLRRAAAAATARSSRSAG